MRTNPHRWSATLAVVATTLLSGHLLARRAPAAEGVPFARRLPPNVYAYLTIPSIPECKTDFGRTQFGRMLDEKSLADVRKEVAAQIDEFSRQMQEQLGVDLQQLLSVPQGELSVAAGQLPGQSLAVVALIDFGTNRATVTKLLDKADTALKDRGAKRKSEEFEKTPIVSYALADPNADDAQAPPKTRFAYFLKGSHLVLGNDVPLLHEVLVRWDGKHDSTFAENEVHRYITERTVPSGSKSDFFWYVDPVGLLKAALTTGAQGNLQAAMVLGFLPALGINNLKAIGGSGEMATETYDSVSRTLLYVDFPTTGLLNVFQFPARPQTPPAWVSARASSYFAFNWNVVGAYEAVETLVDTFNAPGTFQSLVDNIAKAQRGPKIHPKKDFIDHLTGQVVVVTEPNATGEPADESDESDTPAGARLLIALGLKAPEKMQDVLAALAKTEGFPGKVRQFQGHTLYEIPTGVPAASGPMTIGFGLANDFLMITSDIRMLEQVFQAEKAQPTLAGSAAYKKIAAHFPEKTSIVGFQRQDVQLQSVYEMLRSGQANGSVLEGVDFSKLPPFETLRKYLPPAGSYAIPDEHGALFVNFVLK